MRREMPINALCKLLDYNHDTGALTWKPRPIKMFPDERARKIWNTRYANKDAGCVKLDGRGKYIHIGLPCGQIYAHRIAYAIYYGGWPKHDIDHIDGDGLNNKISNLRVASKSVNGRNARKQINNTSGCTGVCKHKKSGKWMAQGKSEGMQYYLGSFDNFDDAVAARKDWEQQNGFTARHGCQS